MMRHPFLGSGMLMPPGICSVTPDDDDEPLGHQQNQMQQGGGSARKPKHRPLDERHDDRHAPKSQQVDKGSTGKGDAGLGSSNEPHKLRPDRDHTPTL